MTNLILENPGVAYAVIIGTAVDARERLSAFVAGRDALIVTDENVAPHHLDSVRAAFDSAARLEALALAAGEGEKTLAGFERIINALVVGKFHRDAVVVALGGGVIGDMAGFAAACYQRGVDWIVVPTTLLSQVDASIGGKTAVNHAAGKNLVGAFHDPLAVWADPAKLVTLPPREYHAGLGEVVKYGLGFDAELFDWLEAHSTELCAGESATVAEVIARCARIKLEVVAADRTEQSARGRILLNLGHTLGHALETVLGYGHWLHGEAVAVGLVAATELSCLRGTLSADTPERLRRLLHAFDLPVAIPAETETKALLQFLALDKKIVAGRLRFIGLEALGRAAVWDDVTESELEQVIAATRNR